MIVKKLIKPISKVGVANIDLENYYTKPQVDSKLEAKQDTLTAGNNISIQNNVISANVPTIDLSNYYNKSEIDNKVDTINGDITTIRNDLGDLGDEVNTNTNTINSLSTKVETNTQNITTINNNTPNYVVKNATNTISTSKLLTTTNQNNTMFEINSNFEKKMYFDFVQNNIGYRNWNHLIFRAKFANNDYVNILDAYSKNVNEGLFLEVENNKVNFANPTLIGGVDTPIGNNDVANKVYVDTQIANIPSTDLTNYYTRAEVDAKIDWEVASDITRGNNETIIPLNGKRFVHIQGRFTQFTTQTGAYFNFTPFTLDTQNYHFIVRFPIFNWNTQAIVASIECDIENDNLILRAHNLSNQSANYYLWGDVLLK